MDERIGATLGRYEITGLVGRGGMATVYEAHDPVLDRRVAVKVLHSYLAQEEAFVGRFRHEAQAVAALRHPNIVRVFDFGVENGDHYMVMEFIDGGTLAALLQGRRHQAATPAEAALSPLQVVRLATPLCSAIDYAAGQGMIHRDIKPSNIMLTTAGEPILTDYGIAKMLGVTSFTASGTVMGSAYYMAPEQAQGLSTDVRTDIYALGVVLFQTLTGRVPYDADTTGSVLAQHMVAPVPSLALLNPDLAPEVQQVLEKALAKDPAARYQTAEQFADGLKAVLERPAGRRPAEERAAAPVAETVIETARPAPGGSRIEGVGEQAPAATPVAPLTAQVPPSATPAVPSPTPPVPLSPAEPYPYPEADWGAPARLTFAQRMRKHPGLVAGAAIVVMIAIILGAVLSTRNPKTTTTTGGSSLVSTVSSLLNVVSTAPFMTTSPTGSTSATDLSPQTAGLRAEADTLLTSGKFNEAVAKYEQALQQNPDDVAARTGLGIAYFHLPKSPEIGAHQLETAVARDPGNVKAWVYLGACRCLATELSDGQDFSLAEQACNKALELDPNSALAHAFLGEIYAASRRPEDATNEASRAVGLAPADPEVLVCMGDVKASAEDWQGSIPYYKRALTLAPSYADYVLALAAAYRETAQYDAALEYCRNALQLGEGYEYAAYRGIGRTLWDRGDFAGAETNLEKALELDDTDAMSHWALGGVYYEEEDYETALPELERAVALRPNNAGMLEWLGACYMALGYWEDARAALEKSVQLDPSRTDAQDLLDQLTAEGH